MTILDGGQTGTVVTAPAGLTAAAVLDGFTVRGGSGESAGGLNCESSSPTIANNTFTGNNAEDGAAIRCNLSSPTITKNTINANTITNNSSAYAGAISCFSSSPTISSNTISGNTVTNEGGAFYLKQSSPTIVNDLITGNSAQYGGAFICYNGSSPMIVNNTLVGNTASVNAGALYSYTSAPTVRNNIIASNSSGIYQSPGGTISLDHNCLFANTGYNYSGLSAGLGDISADPIFSDSAGGDYHPQPGSPCIDTGSNTGAPTTDRDGYTRPTDGNGDGIATCDMGAFEFRHVLHVKQNSPGPIFDGSTWATAFHSVQAGIDAAAAGDEVWVAAATYVEPITLKEGVRLLGGFAGSENVRSQRNWAANTTILDGSAAGSVVTLPTGATLLTRIDGFTIRNGNSASFGSGISCFGDVVIVSNMISSNSAELLGGGILVNQGATATISNNTITQNRTGTAGDGGGIYCHSGSRVTISSNRIMANNSWGGRA